jgi:hypothetical protein
LNGLMTAVMSFIVRVSLRQSCTDPPPPRFH